MQKVENLSAVVLTKNEEDNIKRCLDSLQFCGEIVVIDDNSEDKTVEIAEQSGATIYSNKLLNDFAAQRNLGMEKATGEWILYIDSDEVVTPELAKEISQAIKSKEIKAYYLKRRDFWWGKELRYGETHTARTKGFIRLIPKNAGKWSGNVHEIFITAKSTSSLNSYIDHYPHPTVKDFINKVNFYSTIRAKELYSRGKTTNILEVIFYPIGKFKWNYCIKLGFLDGAPGFAYSFFLSFHSFLVRAKLYQYWNIDLDNERK